MVLLAKRVSASEPMWISTSVSSASLNLMMRSASASRSSGSSGSRTRLLAKSLARREIVSAARAHGRRHFANATPTLTLRKRAGEAPWPVPMVCMGWPLPQFGVPQSVQ